VSTDEVQAHRDGLRAIWGAGDWPSFARLVWEVGQKLVDRVGVEPGDDVLDIACGTGNAAIRAAQAGGRAVGCDLVPDHFEAGRKLAAEHGVEVEFVEANAEALPGGDDSYDVVLSIFGHMFAPRHELAAAEIGRVLRPGGKLGLCTWIPDGNVGSFFTTVAGHMPPPPEFAQPPLQWGLENHVRELLEPLGFELECARESIGFDFDSVEAAVAEYEEAFGPIVMAKAALEPEGRWGALREDLLGVFDSGSTEREGGGITFTSDYLMTTGWLGS
jgi:SAM-dependent methyltransferase